jgi:hypothetical protein
VESANHSLIQWEYCFLLSYVAFTTFCNREASCPLMSCVLVCICMRFDVFYVRSINGIRGDECSTFPRSAEGTGLEIAMGWSGSADRRHSEAGFAMEWADASVVDRAAQSSLTLIFLAFHCPRNDCACFRAGDGRTPRSTDDI